MGMILSQAHDYLLAQRTVEKPPSVNDLARLLSRLPKVISHRRRKSLENKAFSEKSLSLIVS
jgi:hypothetical protein